jgi:hypothetical protein
MASEVSRLLRRAELIDVTQTRLVRRFAQELARVLREVERELPRLYARAQGTAERIQLAQLAQLQVGIRHALSHAGYEALVSVTATSRLANRIATLVLRSAPLGADLVTVTPRIQALQALMRQDWLGQGDVIARSLWQATVRAALAQVPATELAKQIAPDIERSVRQARSLVDTALSIYSRKVEEVVNPEADAYLYIGPADAKARPFCVQRVGKVYSRTAIDKMDNGQLPNVFISGGGHNCRHRWMALSRFSELNDLVDTGKRVPEIAAQLRRVA